MELEIKDIKIKLKDYFVKASYQLFIEPLELISQNGDEIIFKTPNEWSKTIIEDRFISVIQKVIEEITGTPMKIGITIE